MGVLAHFQADQAVLGLIYAAGDEQAITRPPRLLPHVLPSASFAGDSLAHDGLCLGGLSDFARHSVELGKLRKFRKTTRSKVLVQSTFVLYVLN